MNHNWDPPQLSWFKCNIGASWSSNSSIEGASWVLRDADGNVSIFTRRAFFYSFSLHELKFNALFWTMESMTHHRINRVTFDTDDVVGSVMRPKGWPSFKTQSAETLLKIRNFEW